MINAQRSAIHLKKKQCPNYASTVTAQPQAPKVTIELNSILLILLISFTVSEAAYL